MTLEELSEEENYLKLRPLLNKLATRKNNKFTWWFYLGWFGRVKCSLCKKRIANINNRNCDSEIRMHGITHLKESKLLPFI